MVNDVDRVARVIYRPVQLAQAIGGGLEGRVRGRGGEGLVGRGEGWAGEAGGGRGVETASTAHPIA